jgi:hypothetical protein
MLPQVIQTGPARPGASRRDGDNGLLASQRIPPPDPLEAITSGYA